MCINKKTPNDNPTMDQGLQNVVILPNKDNDKKITDQLRKKGKVIDEKVDEDSGNLEYFTE